MTYDRGRLWMRLISQRALRDYMEFRGETNSSLAARTNGAVKRGIIGHLRSGKRTSCSPHTAAAIERALNAPPNSLFVGEVTTGQVAVSRARAA